MRGSGGIAPFNGGTVRASIWINGVQKRRVFATAQLAEIWLGRLRKTRAAAIASKDARRRASRIGVVYFIGAAPLGKHPIKIGFSSDNGRARLVSTQVGNPLPLFVHAEIPGTRALEKWLHAALHASRMKGEWFAPDTLLVSLIKALQVERQLIEAQTVTLPRRRA